MCHAMPFLARALKKNIFFDVDVVVKNKSKCGLSWSVLLPTTSMCHYSFPKHFFSYCFCILASLQKFLKGKSDAYKQLICIMQRVHCQVRVGVFSCQDKYLFRYLWYCGKKTKKKQIECGLAWSVLLSTTIRVITVVKMLCNKLSCITKRALCFSY